MIAARSIALLYGLGLLAGSMSPCPGIVVINEFLASNQSSLADEDGDFPDWIELLNTGAGAVNLNGYGLSDDPSDPFKWTFGPTTLQPGEFLVVFASGKDRPGVSFPPLDPATVPGLTLWLSATDIPPNDPELIRFEDGQAHLLKWPDRSGQGHDATQTSEADQPLFVPDGLRGLPSVRFDGLDDHLVVDGAARLHDGNNVTILALLQPREPFRRPTLFSTRQTNAPGSFQLEFNDNSYLSVTTPWEWNAQTSRDVIGTRRPNLIGYSRDAALSQLLTLDGKPLPLGIDDPRDFFNNESPGLIGAGERLSSIHFFNGDLAELLLFDRALTATERIGVERHLMQQRGLVYLAPHAGFRIDADGEELLLTAPNGFRMDHVPDRPLPRDHSWGRQPDGSAEWRLFDDPTPHRPNTTPGFQGFLDPPAFSQTAGFHPTPFNLELSAAPGATIYYTLDGSEPHPDHLDGNGYHVKNTYPDGPLVARANRTFLYTEPIPIDTPAEATDDIALLNTWYTTAIDPGNNRFKGTLVRARAFHPEFLPGEPASATFFVHPQGHDRYDLPVLSIATDPAGLFDYDLGIYTPGRIFDEWRQANPSLPPEIQSPANYHQRGDSWERSGHLEFFEPGGTPGFRQHVALRIQGGFTRGAPRKSLRVYAEDGPDFQDAIQHEVFPGLTPKTDPTVLLTAFERLLLRNSGNDWPDHLYKDAMMQRLVEHLSFDTQAFRPAVHFINGEYWGLINIRERQDEHFIASHYGVDPDDIVILERNATLTHGIPGDAQSYLALREFVATNDLSLDETYEFVGTQVDTDNFIEYHVANIFFRNHDWPANNIQYWRKRVDPPQPNAPPGHDGRWRWMMFDTDFAFAFPEENTLALATEINGPPWPNPDWSTLLFRSLLEDPTFKHRFVNTFADHLNSSFLPSRVHNVIDSIHAAIETSIPEHQARWGSGGSPPQPLKDFATARPNFVRQHIQDHFALSGTQNVSLNVSDQDHGMIRINSLLIADDTVGVGSPAYPWQGTYFRDVPVTITAIPKPGYRFAGWSESQETSRELVVTLENDLSLTANFQSDVHRLADGAYRFFEWAADEPAGIYPPSMMFFQTAVADPPLATEMDSLWTLPYNLTSRSRILGLGPDGFSFLNTANPQDLPNAGFLGAAVLSLNTLDRQNILVSWTGGTLEPNSRAYAIRLQYRVGSTGPFLDLLDDNAQPVEYLRHDQSGHSQILGPVLLPPPANDQPLVQLRWKYHYVSGDDGPRAQLRVDDIQVTAGHPQAQSLALVQVPSAGQTGYSLGPVRVEARADNGLLATGYNGLVQLELIDNPGALRGTLIRSASNGVALFDDLLIDQPGAHTLTASADGLIPAASDTVIQVVRLTSRLLPRFIQGAQPGNNDRVPFAFRLQLEGLRPNATYRYANRIVTAEDLPTQDGAGNMLFVTTNGAPFIRTTQSPRFETGDLDTRHGELLTASQGVHTGWFVTEPSGNSRFAPGNTVFVRLLLNDGQGGEAILHFLNLPEPVEVMAFGSAPQEGSGLYATSTAPDRNFVALYETPTGEGRPLSVTVVEASGAGVDERYADFYEGLVAGQSGRWGTLVPNGLAGGVQRIEQRDLLTGEGVSLFLSPRGHRPTINLSGGTTAVGIRVPGQEEGPLVAWQAGQFTLAELAEEAISGLLADPEGDGVPNLFEYALGLNPWEPDAGGLPVGRWVEIGGEQYLSFEHRRLIGEHGLDYRVEISTDLEQWTDAEDHWSGDMEVEPTGDGLTERVTRLLPLDESTPHRFLRLAISQRGQS